MRSTYVKKIGAKKVAVLTLQRCPYMRDAFFIQRINVIRRFRGQGIGTELLQRVVEDADYEEVKLTLTINPFSDADLNYDQLQSWYERYGFVETAIEDDQGFFVREPE